MQNHLRYTMERRTLGHFLRPNDCRTNIYRSAMIALIGRPLGPENPFLPAQGMARLVVDPRFSVCIGRRAPKYINEVHISPRATPDF